MAANGCHFCARFVQRQHDRRSHLPEQGRHILVSVPGPGRGVEHQHHHVHFPQSLDCGIHHAHVHAVQRTMNARRVDEDNLAVGVVLDAEDAGPGRLRLVRHDRHPGADDRIQQRGFPGIGTADEADGARLHARVPLRLVMAVESRRAVD
jgi:hypothetical protein